VLILLSGIQFPIRTCLGFPETHLANIGGKGSANIPEGKVLA
jgi:hypothetical protein